MQIRPSASLVAIVLLISSTACRESAPPTNGSAETELIHPPPGSQESFALGQAELIPGTSVFRANLSVSREAGFTSEGKGTYYETRNILFIDPSDKAAHWLLPDTNHVIEETTEIGEASSSQAVLADYGSTAPKKTIAILAYVKANRDHWRDFPGELLLSDSTGRRVVPIADEVKDIQVSSLQGSEIVIIYERKHRLVLQAFDSTSLAKKREQEIEIPMLK